MEKFRKLPLTNCKPSTRIYRIFLDKNIHRHKRIAKKSEIRMSAWRQENEIHKFYRMRYDLFNFIVKRFLLK